MAINPHTSIDANSCLIRNATGNNKTTAASNSAIPIKRTNDKGTSFTQGSVADNFLIPW